MIVNMNRHVYIIVEACLTTSITIVSKSNPYANDFSSRLLFDLMSLKRKCAFGPIEPSSSATFVCPDDESIELSSIPNAKFIKTEQLLHRTSPSNNTFYNNNSPTDDNHNERK